MAFVIFFIGLFFPRVAYSAIIARPADLIDNCQSFETGDDLSYNWVLPRLSHDVKFVKFEVRAEHGALIGLSRQNMVLDSMYEIEIGANFNSRSVIRRCHQCTATAVDNEPGRLSGTESRVFWILVYQGIVAVGSDNSLDPFLVWIDRYPLEINHVGFTTGGVAGWWKFSKYPGTFTYSTTGDNCVVYPFVSIPNGDFEIDFSLKWKGTAALELAEEQKSKNCYFIVFVHAENEYDLSAEIRINEHPVASTTYSPRQSIESEDPANFYVRVEDETLQVGERYREPFLELPGVNASLIRHLGFSSFVSDSADWYFPDMVPDVIGYAKSMANVEDCLCYRDVQVFYTDGVSASLLAIHGYTVGEYELQFKLKAEGRARIILTDSPMGSTDGYNIVFDDGHDSGEVQTSYISLNGEVLQSIEEDLLSESTNRPFYIRYTQQTLSVGNEGSPPILFVEEVPYDSVQYIRFQTEHGERGRWTFYDVQVKSTVGVEPIPTDTHIYSYHTSGSQQSIYPFAPLPFDKFEFDFEVQSGGDAFVSLSPLPLDQKSYMFVFDRITDVQTSSVVQYDDQVFDKYEGSLLSKDEFTKMYVRREDSTMVAGKIGEDPILQVQGLSEPFPRFINFGNLNGDITKWRFFNVSPAARGEVSIYLQALDEPVYDLQIPPGDFTFLFSALVTDAAFMFFTSEPRYQQGVGYQLSFMNSDSMGTSRVDVSYNGVAIASYSGNRLSLGDRAYLFAKLVDSTLCIGISGEDTPLLHLSQVDVGSLKYIGLQRVTTGIDLWTFFGLKYIGEDGHDDRVLITNKSGLTGDPVITQTPPPEGNATLINGSSGGGQAVETGINAGGGEGAVPAVQPPNYDKPIEMSGNVLNVTTDGTAGYVNKLGPLDLTTGSRGQFAVKADKNVAVALISHNGSDTDYYEILIGTGDNLKTELKRCLESVCYTVLSEDTPYVLKSIKKTLFFIEVIPAIDGSLKIRLGKGDVLDAETITLLSYEDSEPLKIEYVGIRTYGVLGDWTIHHKLLLPEDLTNFQTETGSDFQYYPLLHHEKTVTNAEKPKGLSRFEFGVISPSQVILSLSADRTDQHDRYEIRIGADGNTKLSLYRCEAMNCTLLETALEYGVLKLRQLTAFFLELSSVDGGALFISLGKLGGIDLMDRRLLMYTIPDPLQVAIMGFRTPNSAGYWVINQFIRYDSATSKFVTQQSQHYVYQLGPFAAADEARIDFSIQSACQAEIVFKATTTAISDNYTLAIGTDNNQMMIITKCVSSECKQLHVIQTPDILSSLFPAFFYINIIFKDGTLSARIGKASLAGSLRSDGSALVVFEDPEPIHVMYAGFRTTKCSGVWTSSKQIISKPEATTTTKAVKQPTTPVVPQPGPTENGSNQSAAALAAPSALEEEPSDKVTFTTSGLDNESPRYEVGPLDSSRPSRFEFLVTAAAGAVVSLSPAVDSEYPSYKLHIGVNRNSETHIMRCTSIYYCTAVLTVQTDSILTSSKPVKFFVELIRCGRTNKLNVRLGQIAGAAGADSVILDYEETYPLEIGWAGFGTIEGFTGQWTVYKFIFYSGTTLISSFNTGKGPGDSIYPRSYSVLRDQSEMRFSFSVKAEQNALIALSNQASVLAATDVIQIRLGVDNNQRSTLSKNNIEIVSVQGDHLLRFSDVTFWVSIDGNIIEVGMGSGDRFMGAVLDEPIHAKYIWFAAGDDGLTYEWQFYKYFYYSASTGHLESTHDIDLFQAHIYEQSSLEEKFEYSFHPLHENYFGKYIEFTVTTEGAVSIALSADGSQQVEMYEIVFSGNRNSDLSLRRCSSCETLVSSYEEGGFLLPGRVRNFLISVYDGTIRVYDEQLTDPLLEWTDPEPLPVSFAGFSMTSSSHFAYTTVPTAGSYTDEAPSPYFYAVQLATDKPWKVVLSISGEQKGEVYEIVYGTGENTRSEIRRGNVPIASVENAGLVSAVNPNYYWFEVKNNVIKTGLFDPDSSQQCEPFLGYYDPDFIPVSLFRISTSDPAAVFNFGFGSGFSPRLEPGNRICEPYAHAVYTSEEVEMVGKEGAVSDGESSDHESKSKEKRSSNERRNDRSSEENISSNESGSKEGMRSSEQSGRSQMTWSSEENAGNNEVRNSNEKSDSDETKSSEESGNSEEKRENDGKNKDKKNKGSKEDRSNSEEKRESEGKNKKGERKESSDEDRSGSEEKRNSKEKSSKEKGKKKNRGKKKESSEDSK